MHLAHCCQINQMVHVSILVVSSFERMVRIHHFIASHPFKDEAALGSDDVRQRSVLMDMPFCGRPRKPRPLRSHRIHPVIHRRLQYFHLIVRGPSGDTSDNQPATSPMTGASVEESNVFV
ncbi:predicted protein [Aspergillus terreus NIH2624]|uniref:Uncharacterized protein n=1 Tax=Aspergillus terreus (strain NIH 2624 / FGSC A1156) TaxID=341663 RepID=Q0CQT6_ASPTN|nr:uncharacterized protein ATEG_03948 [Aspergillus terreus NIH2624]EAU35750.1 predicted protein [Aspergillus terreus NIH2624]